MTPLSRTHCANRRLAVCSWGFRSELSALARPQVWFTLAVGMVGFGGMFATYSYIAPTVTTLAGLGTPEKPHPLQTAYIEEQVPQCGYCINGWIMTAADLLAHKKGPTEAEIKDALSGVKCRCGTHISILKAVKRAAEMMG